MIVMVAGAIQIPQEGTVR